jgi:hypothetical protein
MPRPGDEESWVQHTPDYSMEGAQASPASAHPEMSRQEKLNCIALTLEYWLNSQASERKNEGIETTDDTAIISPPSWPTRGTLKEWIRVLRG